MENTKFQIYLSPPSLSGTELSYIKEALTSNWIAPLGPMVDAFEREFSETVQIPYVVALNSGTSALHLALRCVGAEPGDVVLASTLTFIGGVAPIVYLGAIPWFIDAAVNTWTMDVNRVDEALKKASCRGLRVRAIVPTDLYGQSCDIDMLRGLADQYGAKLICDSAEALGSMYKGRSVGKGATAAVFSFNGNKIITTSGGGMLASDDSKLINHARFLSQQARDPASHYEHSTIGYNYRLSNLLAAVGRAQLSTLWKRVNHRRRIFAQYKSMLNVPGISFMPEAAYGTSSRWLTVIIIDSKTFGVDREYVRTKLESAGIESRPVWKPMHMQPVFRCYPRFGGSVSETIFRDGLCLPSGSQMSEADIERVSRLILSAAGAKIH